MILAMHKARCQPGSDTISLACDQQPVNRPLIHNPVPALWQALAGDKG